jgi:cation diffusion facilitator CzcD-associated flavoprotein CzcO
MTVLDATTSTAEAAFADWVARLDAAASARDAAAMARLVDVDGFWKDILALEWGYRSHVGHDAIVAALEAGLAHGAPRNFRPSTSRSAPRVVRRSAKTLIEAYFDFETSYGSGTGFVRLHHDEAGTEPATAWIVLTTLQSLHGFEEKLGKNRPNGSEYAHDFAGENWLDLRTKERQFADRDPQVLVVGGGQGGLMVGARLRQMGVDTLIVEKSARIGDNWRQRYHSLTLHNETWGNSLPYVPFPDTWPTFLPKDKLAAWLESYVETMELNVWTSTVFLGAERTEDDSQWIARLLLADGTERVVHTPHIIFATGGHSGVPHVPQLPGIETFEGEVLHSSQFSNGAPYAGRHAIVFGTGNSGHDIAQDLFSNGAAKVTMIQRSPTCVVSLVPSGTMVYSIYSEGPPPEDVDLITGAIPYPVLKETYQWLTKTTCKLDQELLDGLEAAGFRTDFEPDGTGFHMRYLRKGGGYYINVGCSDLIVDGKIAVEQASGIASFDADGLRMDDGRHIAADLVVLATGYQNQQEGVRRLLGDEVADTVGPIWGFDEHGTMRNMWQVTPQAGLWVMGGALMEARFHSRFLAVQIRAQLEGLMPAAAGSATAGEDR